MRKSNIIIGFVLIGMLLITFNFGFTTATNNYILINDTDNDGIDDAFEQYNKRNIEVIIEANEILINSVRRNDVKKDQLITKVVYDGDGIHFQISYFPNVDLDFNLTFSLIYRELIEFVDLDYNGIFNPEVDQNIQNISLKEFSPAVYVKDAISSDTDLHRITLQTENKTFSLHIYFAEEFAMVENTLITPGQARTDIEISNVYYLNDSSDLALNLRLESEEDFQIQEETEDEKSGYASDEKGLVTALSKSYGFITWREIGFIDNVSNPILLSDLMIDEISEDSQKVYINYQKGAHIYHVSKFGIEGLLLKEPFSPINIFVILIIVGAVSAAAIYSFHYYKKDHGKRSLNQKGLRSNAKAQKHELKQLFDSKLALQMLAEGNNLEILYDKGNVNLTTISEDFQDTVNRLGLKGHDKSEFVKEMLSLPPYEREQFLRDMLIQIQ